MRIHEILTQLVQHKAALTALLATSLAGSMIIAGTPFESRMPYASAGTSVNEVKIEETRQYSALLLPEALSQNEEIGNAGGIDGWMPAESVFVIPTPVEAVLNVDGETNQTTEATYAQVEVAEETLPIDYIGQDATQTAVETTTVPQVEESPAEVTVVPDETTSLQTPAPETTMDTAANPTGSFDSQAAAAVLDFVNAKRAEAGLPGLTWNSVLAESADIRAPELIIKWSHTRPDGSDWYTAGAQLQMGENLAYGQTSAEQVVAEWMASPSHAENILRVDYTQMGVSCYIENGTYYWVQHFA